MSAAWHSVRTPSDADALMDAFGSFHDACIRDMRLWGRYVVNRDLSMSCATTPDLSCRLLVQRQWRGPAAIELLFDGVSHLSLAAPADYDRIIMQATLRVDGGSIVWSPDPAFEPADYEFGVSSAIVAQRLWWREAPDGLGPDATVAADLPGDFAADPPAGYDNAGT